MLQKGKKIYGIVHQKCPACHEGPLFVEAAYFDIKKMGKTHDACPACGQDYRIEPGFYWGALYIAYGFSVFVSLLIFLLFFLLFGLPLNTSFVLLVIADLILTPFLYKLSKTLWLHIFVRFRHSPE